MVKGQVLADFVTEFSSRREVEVVHHMEVRPWKVFVNSASRAMGAGVGIVIIMSEGIQVEHSFRLGFKASKNEVEYEALLAELKAVLDLGAQEVEVHWDSRLVVKGSFEAKDPG